MVWGSKKAPHPLFSAPTKKSLASHFQRSDTIRRSLLVVFIGYNITIKISAHLNLWRPIYLPMSGGTPDFVCGAKKNWRPTLLKILSPPLGTTEVGIN